jgi:hypothetical protein
MRAFTLLTLLVICSTACIAQDSTAEYKARRQASFKMMAPHGYLTVFIGEDINDATVPLQLFFTDNMQMILGDADSDYKVTKTATGSTIRMTFKEQISYGNQKRIVLTLNVNEKSKIQSCTFTGDRIKLIDFFVKYWNTNVQSSDKNNVIAVRMMPGEKAELLNNKAVVSIKVSKI